jgi:hypothetical protein
VKFPDGTIQTTAGGTITGVTAGTGLTGGGTSGNITLSIANLGVTNALLANSTITAPKIANGQVVKSFNGLTDNVTLAAGSNITITPSGNTLTIASTGGGSGGILNQTTLQTSADFNIDGTGAANIISAETQFNLGNQRILSSRPTTELRDIFVGYRAGTNTLFSQTDNSFIGYTAGTLNRTGSSNSFFGSQSGFNNDSGSQNVFVGASAGGSNTTGSSNVFVGGGSGGSNRLGNNNTFLGTGSGGASETGSNNTYLGYNAKGPFGSNFTNANAIGANSTVEQSDSLVLGSINGVNNATADTRIGIGTTTPKAKLDVTGGNILVGSPGQGMILKSPNGATCKLLSIDNAGAMVLAAVACP